MKKIAGNRIKLIIIVAYILILYIVVAGMPEDSKTPAEPGTLRIVSANLLYSNTLKDKITQTLLDLKADIIVLIEYRENNTDIEALTNAGYTLHLEYPANGGLGMAMFIKTNITAYSWIIQNPVKGPMNIPFLLSDISLDETGNKELSVMGVHLPFPGYGGGKKIPPTIDVISNYITDDRPFILAGDFNTFAYNEAFDILRAKELKDAFIEVNWRPGPTWGPSLLLPSVARIDYIWVSKSISVSKCFTIAIPGSDHRAIVADLTL